MSLSTIPNPKQLTRDRNNWYSYYAGFSPIFAKSVLGMAGLVRKDLVLDPWNGAGTTTWAASLAGYRAAGFDLNPVMVEIARGRVLPRCRLEDARQAAAKVTTARPIGRSDDPLLIWFVPDAGHTIRGLAEACSSESDPVLRGFLHTSLFNTVRFLTRSFRSSNPTWVKHPSSGGLQIPAAEVVSRFEAEVKRFMDRPPCDWPDCEAGPPAINVADAARIPLSDGAAAAVLTSPPYCTRIDYAQNTCVELAVLGQTLTESARLRDRLTGTPTIRALTEPILADWGVSCCRLLDAVLVHPSKSSASYYWKTLVQYFGDLYRGVQEAARCLRRDGTAVFVVQGSRYKDLNIDLARIVAEMAKPFGWVAGQRIDYSTKRTLRSVNTRSRMYQAEMECVESVLCFKASN